MVAVARHPRWVQRFLSRDDLTAIIEAIARAEALTSAEVRVHLERRVRRAHAGGDRTLARARDVFARLEMHQTTHRGGVLIYLAVEDRKLAIIGDDAIHARVGDEYWNGVRDGMVARLREGRARDAVVEAVGEVGRALSRHFPRRSDDRPDPNNDLSVS